MAGAKRVLLLGGSGTIGRAVLDQLISEGHSVTAVSRGQDFPAPAITSHVDLTDPGAIKALFGTPYDAVISCLASRKGSQKDAWAIDHDAHVTLLDAAELAKTPHFILLSAICVQKPRLPFQHAKLAFESRLRDSILTHTIIRPTAYFKSLTGQIDRIQSGKPYLTFGSGEDTPCKPISDADLARFITSALTDPQKANQTLPIGGPGPAVTHLEIGKTLFERTGQTPKFRYLNPKRFLQAASLLATLGKLIPPASALADYLRIAEYYATEPMLYWDPETQEYDEDATPEYGETHILDHLHKTLSRQ